MFLKSIEIRGFKSFADKTELSFKNGVTAVVGPNGSGKSNISDAVRWVLGEQSIKSLRGGKMEDVIFAGTQFRKPVGLAQVALTLDNSDYALAIDYTDVTISRRLYRSGESEYYINNTQCRLKDIQELFMDTGIGKEGYSIIGQGKIDAILSGKPEERRNLLEEAAGIVKFKTRKEEAERRLSNTDANLVRINDILSTYEERLEPLRIENEKAKTFVALSEELKTKEVTLVLHSIESIQDKVDSAKKNILTISNDIENLLTERNTARLELQKWNDKLESHERKNEEERDKYYELKNRQQSLQSEINLLTERINNLVSYLNKASIDLKELKTKLEGFQAGKDSMEGELNSYQESAENINAAITSLEKSIESLNKKIIEEENNSVRFRSDEIEFLRKISEAKNTSSTLQNNIVASNKKIETIESACEGYFTSIKINTSTGVALEAEIEKTRQSIHEYEEEIRQIKKDISKASEKLTEDEKNLRELTNNSNRLEANHSMLTNLEKQYEGYNKAVKNLMQHIDNKKIPEAVNNCFVLGNIISVDSKYETSIEIALGGAISDIITYHENTAKVLINYLKTNNLGRATFLPLNILQSKPLVLDSKIQNISGFIGIASNLVKYDAVFSKAVEYVLGRTIIATDLDSALIIAKAGNHAHKIVTLSGEVVNPGGSLTGGSFYQKGSNIIGRKREIEELEVKCKEIKGEIESLVREINIRKNLIKELDSKGLNLRDEIHFKHIEITKLEGKVAAIASDSEKLKQNLKTSREEVELIRSKNEEFESNLDNINERIKELSIKEEENKNNISRSEELVKAYENELKMLKDQFLEQKIKKAQIDEIVLARIKELERIEKETEFTLQKIKEVEIEINKSSENMESSKLKIHADSDIINNIGDEIKSIEKLFEENEMIRIELKEYIKKVSEKGEELSILVTKKEDEKHRGELSLAKLEAETEALFSKLNDELGLTYAEAAKYRVEMPENDKFKAEISALKIKISALGVVNLGAIQEYEEVKQKFSFMSTQKEDLIKAKNELVSVINEMTEKMKEVFNENFLKLKENFNETFRELFKGGSADLILSDGDELSANIEINVQPPGKKLQNINLMSGGEKGLSAIALLFAILKMKPTPFCILDEIEAALDDANVFRYAEFLKKFSQNIQFIVITHRKGTMEASDVLYGVTMQEKGVSKIVSVDLAV